VTKGDHGLGLV